MDADLEGLDFFFFFFFFLSRSSDREVDEVPTFDDRELDLRSGLVAEDRTRFGDRSLGSSKTSRLDPRLRTLGTRGGARSSSRSSSLALSEREKGSRRSSFKDLRGL